MFFSLFVFVSSTSQVSYARHPKTQLDLSADLASFQAERLIRSFNLSPKQAVNIDAFDDLQASNSCAPKIADKQFQFHVLGKPGPSVQEFGHYRLPHTTGAR
jgi:serine carboxypeptidase-like clade 4